MIDEESLSMLLDRLRDFLYKEYSLNPTPNELEEVCQAAVQLFPSLASNTIQKIVIFFRFSICDNNIDSFRFSHRIFYMIEVKEVDFCTRK